MTPEQLKNSILQLAIQGKLVKQRKEEGTGEELFEEIQKEKLKLIKEGKLKKQKALPDITEDEIPFDIPETWKWVRCGDILNIVSAKRVHQSDWQNKGIPFYRAREISRLSEFGTVDNDLFISEELFNSLSTYGLPEKNDLMVSAVGTLGKTYIVKENDRFYYKDASVLCFKNYAQINTLFLKYAMESSLMKNQIDSNSRGTTVGTLTIVRMSNYIIPLPPLAEQKRIVEEIEELLPLVDRYEKAWTRLEELNKKFPLNMQKSILQEAIQGKLVEQRKEEGTGEELFKEIQKEKQKLIEEGKLKKQKALPEITEDEIPFDIPDTWRWVRLGEMLYKLTDGTHSTPKYTLDGIPFISVKDLSSGYLNFESCKYIKSEEHKILFDRCNPEVGDILLTKVGTTGIPVIVDTDKEFSLFVSVALLKFNQMKLSNFFLKYLINSPLVQIQAKKNTRGVGNKNWVMKDIANTIIPLTPLAEQKRIVKKIEELLPLCERLK